MGAENPGRMLDRIRRSKFSLLLVCLVLLFFSHTLVDRYDPGAISAKFLAGMALVMTLAAAIYAATPSRIQRALLIVVILMAFAVDLGEEFFRSSQAWQIPSYLAHAMGLSYLIALTILHLFRARRVTPDIVSAAICVYLLMAVLWAMLYSVVDVTVPGSFVFNVEIDGTPPIMRFGEGRAINSLYYSLVTMTTLGYGDIVPATGFARMLSATQAVAGSVYMTVLVARLVGLQINQAHE